VLFQRFATLGATLCAVLAQCAARADLIDEIRVGATAHNITIMDEKVGSKESGPNVEGEVVFAPPHMLRWLGAPRPYLMVSYNTHGKTSWAGGGLYWRIRLSENWALEPRLGYVVHNGEIDIPYPLGDPRNTQFEKDNVLLGSRDLFRDTIALERRWGPNFATQLFYEHLSHGNILGQGRNQGMDELGLRAVVRFGNVE
jgi:lipid A 3-O-deacylase